MAGPGQGWAAAVRALCCSDPTLTQLPPPAPRLGDGRPASRFHAGWTHEAWRMSCSDEGSGEGTRDTNQSRTPSPTLRDAKPILTCCPASPAVPGLGAPEEQEGDTHEDTEKPPGVGEKLGLTERGRQVLPAEDFLVQLFCLLVLVLFQVG